MSYSIAILGDSSSASLGGYHATYPNLLFDLLKDQAYIFCNYAVPGLTSSDANALYHDVIKKTHPDYLIIYLGNNESCFSVKKGYISNLRRKISTKIRKQSNSKMRDFYLRFENKYRFTYDYDRAEVANTPEEFSKNVKSIIRTARKNKTRVVLVNPVANRRFLSGAGLPNYLFFKLIGCFDRMSGILKPSDSASRDLVRAINFQENENYVEMKACYEELLKKDCDLLSLIAINNLAVYYFSQDPDRCKSMLLEALNICEIYNPVIYYNLYLHALHTNDSISANAYLQQSYESDFSLYRIKDSYREKLCEIALHYDVSLIDMKDFMEAHDFIDYCHPTRTGHLKIANQLYSEINDINCANKKLKAEFFRKWPSPNYLFRPKENYVDYYYIDDNLSDLEIRETLSILFSKHNMHDVAKQELLAQYAGNHLMSCLISFIASNLSHPIFNESLDIVKKCLPYSHEILVMPENYLFRLLYNYYQLYETRVLPVIKESRKFDERYIESSSFYSNIILRNNSKSLQFSVDLSFDYYKTVYRKLVELVHRGDLFSNTIDQRRRNIIFWYTRECFRYGTHSRLSMLYDRPTIDYCIETMIVLITISFEKSDRNIEKLIGLLQLMQQLIAIHEMHVLKYHNEAGYSSENYMADLSQCKRDVLKYFLKDDLLCLG